MFDTKTEWLKDEKTERPLKRKEGQTERGDKSSRAFSFSSIVLDDLWSIDLRWLFDDWCYNHRRWSCYCCCNIVTPPVWSIWSGFFLLGVGVGVDVLMLLWQWWWWHFGDLFLHHGFCRQGRGRWLCGRWSPSPRGKRSQWLKSTMKTTLCDFYKKVHVYMCIGDNRFLTGDHPVPRAKRRQHHSPAWNSTELVESR